MELKEANPRKKLARCPRLDMNVTTVDAVDQACKGRDVPMEYNKAGTCTSNTMVQLRIVLSKKELKQLLAASNGKVKKGNSIVQTNLFSQPSMEHLLKVLKRKVDANREGRRVKWRPVLRSIPEEI